MHFEHEFVEMDAALPADVHALVEQVHQHRLAAADAAPEVEPARRVGQAAERAPQDAALFRYRLQLARQPVQPLGGGGLFGVGAQFARGDQGVVAGEDVGHMSPFVVPAKAGISGGSACGTRSRLSPG